MMIDIAASHKERIGCSQIAQALNLSTWGTAYQLWEQLTGRAERPNISNHLGVALGEPMEQVLRPFVEQRLGRELRRDRREYLHPDIPLIGHVDYRASALNGEKRPVVDTKTSLGWGAARRFGDDSADDVDDGVLLQMQGYLLLTGAETAYVAALVPGPDLKIYTIQTDPELHTMIVEGVARFWECVKTDTPPPLVSLADASRHWPNHDPDTVLPAASEDRQRIADLRDLLTTIKEMEREADALKLALQVRLENREALVDMQGRPLCTWRTQSSARVDTAALKAAGLYEQFTKNTSSRVFRLKGE
jgi:predicted phage-related endonuclease